MKNTDAPKSGVRGVSWNSQLGRWHVRVRVLIDGIPRYSSFGLYDDLDEAARVAALARAGKLEPKTYTTRARRMREALPSFVSRPGTPPPDLTMVATRDLVAELTRRGHR